MLAAPSAYLKRLTKYGDAAAQLASTATERVHEIEDESTSEAQDQLDHEYEPLIHSTHSEQSRKSDRTGRSKQNSRPDPASRAQSQRSRVSYTSVEGAASLAPSETGTVTRMKRLEMAVSYICFFILGTTILLSWNALIVASSYFQSRLLGSQFETSFASWVAMTFTTGNLIFLAHANYTQAKANPNTRIFISVIAIILVLALLAITTRIESISATAFFPILIACSFLSAAGASYLQNAIVALSALFGPSYLQGILSGQGAIGALVSVIQFASAYGGLKEDDTSDSSAVLAAPQVVFTTTDSPIDDYVDKLRDSAFIFFIVATAMAAGSLVAYVILMRMPYFRVVVRSSGVDDPNDDLEHSDGGMGTKQPAEEHEPVSFRVVFGKVRLLALSVFYVFFVTLSVFPSITASVLSVNDKPGSDGKSPPAIFTPVLFVPLGFIIFNVGDWIGRAMPQIPLLNFHAPKALAIVSVARTAFVPLFLFCNVTAGVSEAPPIFDSDTIFLLLLLLFAISNGYISTLIMITGVGTPELEQHEIDTAATLLAFALTAGLALGSFASFGVRASICRCNPFLQ
ncbi:uncharacterized protein L969DRAFT_46815 [Mixia osmundae IAM 14324]|uniref:Nucleoside transporter n=1 Tax=Mixia osmundae (strain CBS 9802 / IAM 14324 / JCM 22182 / KY 12970) TaxID=764103 RepID=G7E5P2_MIXOS|nr:uncharacterized protein L969DRAFT_46815 [Mixia osmundae IAM 14324]KEI40699.1 hypothetical protein L969DRAFT_46815 [Mixia osmundae IAM 14324]GAA98152.1 hypothetical protein E5Q_04835 [Mixia osmundae IAM 14324]